MNNKTRKHVKNRRKYRGGFLSFFKKKETAPPGLLIDDKQARDDFVKLKTEEESENQKLQKKIEKFETRSSAMMVGYAAASMFMSTGVLAPVGVALGAVLFVSGKVMEMKHNNFALRLLLKDVQNVTSDVFTLYELILFILQSLKIVNDVEVKYVDKMAKYPLTTDIDEPKSDDELKKELEETLRKHNTTKLKDRRKLFETLGLATEATPTEEQQRLQGGAGERTNMNDRNIIQLRIHAENLLAMFLGLCDTKTLNNLGGDKYVDEAGLKPLIDTEVDNRKGTLSWLNRKISKYAYAEYYKKKIVTELVLVDSYAGLVFYNVFFSLKRLEIIDPSLAQILWSMIAKSKAMRNYTEPNLDEITRKAIKLTRQNPKQAVLLLKEGQENVNADLAGEQGSDQKSNPETKPVKNFEIDSEKRNAITTKGGKRRFRKTVKLTR
jgi:hypothetical protein